MWHVPTNVVQKIAAKFVAQFREAVANDTKFLSQIITGDKMWVYGN